MRPYPDPYERRAAPPPPPSAARDDFYYYRRPYEDFGSSYYGSQDGPSQSYGNGYSYSTERTAYPSASRTPAF